METSKGKLGWISLAIIIGAAAYWWHRASEFTAAGEGDARATLLIATGVALVGSWLVNSRAEGFERLVRSVALVGGLVLLWALISEFDSVGQWVDDFVRRLQEGNSS